MNISSTGNKENFILQCKVVSRLRPKATRRYSLTGYLMIKGHSIHIVKNPRFAKGKTVIFKIFHIVMAYKVEHLEFGRSTVKSGCISLGDLQQIGSQAGAFPFTKHKSLLYL